MEPHPTLEWFAVALEPSGEGDAFRTEVYDCHAQARVATLTTKQAESHLHVGLVPSPDESIVLGSYYGRLGVCLYTLGGEPIWSRHDLKKVQSIEIFRSSKGGFRIGVWVEPYKFLVLNPFSGSTLKAFARCVGAVTAVDNSVTVFIHQDSVLIADAQDYRELRKLPYHGVSRVAPGRGGFLFGRHGELIGTTQDGSELFRHSVHGTSAMCWSPVRNAWLVLLTGDVPSHISEVTLDGTMRKVTDVKYPPTACFLASATRYATSLGTVVSAESGAVEWVYSSGT